MRKKPNAVDLFCGAGGLTEGLRQAGYNVIGAVELDALACSTYRLDHRRVRLWEMDITRLSGAAMMKALKLRPGELDLLAACPPCQGFSTMRTKNGTRWNRDPRNNLIFDVLRIIRSMKPMSVMLENVPGLAEGRRYVAFRKGLEALGYRVKWDVLNAVDFAVPQRRRLVLLASRLGELEFAPKAGSYRTVRQFIGNLPPPERSRDPLHNYPIRRSKKVEEIIRRIPRNGGSRLALGRRDQLPCHKRSDGFKDVYGRMAWDKPAPTITGVASIHRRGDSSTPARIGPLRYVKRLCLRHFPRPIAFRWTRGGTQSPS